jgi:cell division protein FtsB
MSMAAGRAASTRPAPRQPVATPRRLRAVVPVGRRRRLPFVLLTLALAVAGVLALVTLNVTVSQQAFEIARLSRENREAERRYTVLQADVDRLKAPGRIARVATSRGMVPAGRPRVAAWPGGRPATGSRGQATSPAAPGTRPGDAAWAEDPFPLKPYLAQP